MKKWGLGLWPNLEIGGLVRLTKYPGIKPIPRSTVMACNSNGRSWIYARYCRFNRRYGARGHRNFDPQPRHGKLSLLLILFCGAISYQLNLLSSSRRTGLSIQQLRARAPLWPRCLKRVKAPLLFRRRRRAGSSVVRLFVRSSSCVRAVVRTAPKNSTPELH